MDQPVRVWIVPVDVPAQTLTGYLNVLDGSERARADAFFKARDRIQFAVAHGALRMLVGHVLGAAPAELAWVTGRHGKPELAPPWSGLHTSLSHSAGLVAAAVSTDRPVGVDIEQLTPGLNAALLSRRFFAPDEAGYVAGCAAAEVRAERFAHLWARKEAVVKASGGRLWPNLRMEVRDRDVVTCLDPAGAHRVADVVAPPGYRAAVALAGSAPFVLAVDYAVTST